MTFSTVRLGFNQNVIHLGLVPLRRRVLAIEAVQRVLSLLAKPGCLVGATGVVLWVEPQRLLLPPPEDLLAKFFAFG
jgi:hypothetical protein